MLKKILNSLTAFQTKSSIFKLQRINGGLKGWCVCVLGGGYELLFELLERPDC